MYPRLLSMLGLVVLAAFPVLSSAQATSNLEPNDFDRNFVQKAMQANEQEVKEGQMHRNSRDQNVQVFARTMIRDHTAAASTLGALANQLNLPYPKGGVISDNPNQQLPGGEPGSGTAGGAPVNSSDDRAYMQKELTDHQNTIALFQSEMKNGNNRNLKQYAGMQLPILQNHLKMVQEYLSGRAVTPEPTPTP